MRHDDDRLGALHTLHVSEVLGERCRDHGLNRCDVHQASVNAGVAHPASFCTECHEQWGHLRSDCHLTRDYIARLRVERIGAFDPSDNARILDQCELLQLRLKGNDIEASLSCTRAQEHEPGDAHREYQLQDADSWA